MLRRMFSTSSKEITTKVWAVQHPLQIFPEQENKVVNLDEKPVGIACSGGGSRSHALSLGYFRALRDLGLQNEASYLSAVSGGSWASSIFTFAKEDEQKLLGASTKPEDCTLKNLDDRCPGTLGKVLAKFYGTLTGFYYFLCGIPPSKLWQRMVGHCLLKDFDLNGKMMVSSEEHLEEILKRNCQDDLGNYKREHFVIPAKDRPFLIINACLAGPVNYNSGWGNSLQFTPLYSGVPFYRDNKKMPFIPWTFRHRVRGIVKALFPSFFGTDAEYLQQLYEEQMVNGEYTDDTLCLTVGGGVMETHSFGAEALKRKEQYYGTNHGQAKFNKDDFFLLEDAVGASSAAYVSAFSNRHIAEYLNPIVNYFPVLSKENPEFNELQETYKMNIADGGNYDNTGLLPLLQRRVKKIVCLINTPSPLDIDGFTPGFYSTEDEVIFGDDDDKEETNDKEKARNRKNTVYYCADTQLLALFGAVKIISRSANYTSNQVFETHKLDEVVQGLIDSVKSGKGGVYKTKLEVIENAAWNIAGGYEPEILFVYNENCHNFFDKLPEETKAELNKEKSAFGDFPFYKTMFQNSRPFSLEIKEINLISAQAEFVVKANETAFREIFDNKV